MFDGKWWHNQMKYLIFIASFQSCWPYKALMLFIIHKIGWNFWHSLKYYT